MVVVQVSVKEPYAAMGDGRLPTDPPAQPELNRNCDQAAYAPRGARGKEGCRSISKLWKGNFQ
jgi:hypothetical protein